MTAVSSRSVQEAIRHLIDGEDARKPLSDEKISQLLRKEGLEVARRTVAKYLGIEIDVSIHAPIQGATVHLKTNES